MTKDKCTARGRRSRLTEELQGRICQFIRAGAYDYAAAEACGISVTTFMDWMRRGRGEGGRPSAPGYVNFLRAVEEAKAEARVSAEIQVRKADPRWWLSRMHRDTTENQGWSSTGKVEVSAARGGIHIHLGEEK